MSKIKLKHSSGNSMSIGAPATNPASDLELKLPATIGTAGQVLKNSSTPGTLAFAPAAAIINMSPLTHDSADAGVTVNNTTENVGVRCDMTRKSATSNFLIYIIWSITRPSDSGWASMSYRRQVNDNTQTGNLQVTKVADAATTTHASYMAIDTTTGSVGDVIKIQPRGTNSASNNNQFRFVKTIVFEFEP